MIGILTEKPSQKNNFVKAFGAVSGTYNGEQYVISNAIGHLFEMAKPDQQVRPELVARYKSWDIAKLPWNERDFVWKKELVTGKGPSCRPFARRSPSAMSWCTRAISTRPARAS